MSIEMTSNAKSRFFISIAVSLMYLASIGIFYYFSNSDAAGMVVGLGFIAGSPLYIWCSIRFEKYKRPNFLGSESDTAEAKSTLK